MCHFVYKISVGMFTFLIDLSDIKFAEYAASGGNGPSGDYRRELLFTVSWARGMVDQKHKIQEQKIKSPVLGKE